MQSSKGLKTANFTNPIMPESLSTVLRRTVNSLNARAKRGVFSTLAPRGKFKIMLSIADREICVWTEEDSWLDIESVCESNIKQLSSALTNLF